MMVISQIDGNKSYRIDIDLNTIDGTIPNSAGQTMPFVPSPAITIFIGGMNKPFPVMDGANDIVLPTSVR